MKLKEFAPRKDPHVIIHPSNENTRTPYVEVVWRCGLMGIAGFCVGSTNLHLTGRDIHAWQPGVYFCYQ
jgi:hypothetical protein